MRKKSYRIAIKMCDEGIPLFQAQVMGLFWWGKLPTHKTKGLLWSSDKSWCMEQIDEHRRKQKISYTVSYEEVP